MEDSKLEERLTSIETKLSGIERTVIKIRKVQRNGNTARAIYWTFIILLGFGAFYFVQPYLTQLKEAYGFVDGVGTDSLDSLNQLINQFKEGDN